MTMQCSEDPTHRDDGRDAGAVLHGRRKFDFTGDTLLTATNLSEDKDHQLLGRHGMKRAEARTLSASA